ERANNLVLDSAYGDMMEYEDPQNGKAFKVLDGTLLGKSWRFQRNRRDLSGGQPCIPLMPEDRKLEKSDLASRSPSHAHYLRPRKDSSLAKDGAGAKDAALPSHGGARPPVGAEAWDWQKTWAARHPKMLLTVSKNPKDKADFRTISGALEKVKPGQTIRVLDSATYAEGLSISRSSSQTGITLESPRRATLTSPTSSNVIVITNVPGVTVRGFRLHGDVEKAFLITVTGKSSGTHLDDLEMSSDQAFSYVGITLAGVEVAEKEFPVLVRNCVMQWAWIGIQISGLGNDYRTPMPCGGIA